MGIRNLSVVFQPEVEQIEVKFFYREQLYRKYIDFQEVEAAFRDGQPGPSAGPNEDFDTTEDGNGPD